MDLNTCFETTNVYHTAAYYSHLLPAVIAIFLGFYALIKTRYSKLSVAFLFFTLAVTAWLLNDVILWTVPNYYYVAFFWSWIDFTNVLFFVLAAFFFGLLARDKISVVEKVILIALCLPALFFTATGNAVTEFNQVWCEMGNNELSVLYKTFAEWATVAMMFLSLALAWKRSDKNKKIVLSVVLVSLLLFLVTFSVTEYIAGQTFIYEINLYGLFVLPIFLVAMVYTITNLQLFQIRYLGTQLLTYVLILMVASQFLFLESSTDAALNVITLVITIFIGLILLRNTKRELEQMFEMRRLTNELAGANARLERLDKMKSEFVSIASHQLRSPLTSVRGYISMMLEGSYGEINPKAKEVLAHVSEASRHMALSIEDYLNVSRIEAGNMKYDIADVEISKLVQELVAEMLPVGTKRGVPIVFKPTFSGQVIVQLDVGKARQIIQNLIDNALKYTRDKGLVTVVLRKDDAAKKVFVDIVDQGIGIDPEEAMHLFEKFERAKNANQVNTTGTGLGLYIARTMARAMKGDISVSSAGEGKGSTFTVSFPINGIESKWGSTPKIS
jgi:signal transduction histidine kinase